MNHDLLRAKLRAFGIHFGLSLLVFFILLYLIIFHWYPPPFFSTDGGWQGIRIIAGVDLVLGPILTFIIFNPHKPLRLLKLDLGLIVLAQVTALSWGIWAVHNERPYITVLADGIFYPIAYYQIEETGLSHEDINKLNPEPPPKRFYVDTPTDEQEYLTLLMEAVSSRPMHYMGDRYQRFDKKQIKSILRFSIDMNAYLKGEAEAWHQEYQKFVNAHPDTLNDMLFFPLNARYGKYIVAVDKSSLDFVDILEIPPPKIDEHIWGKEKAKERRQRQAERSQNAKLPQQPLPE